MPTGDADQDGIDDASEAALAIRYAPRYCFVGNEHYHFVDPSAILGASPVELNGLFPVTDNPECGAFPASAQDTIWDAARPYAFSSKSNLLAFMGAMNESQQPGHDWDSVALRLPDRSGCSAASGEAYRRHLDPQTPGYFTCELNTEGNAELTFYAFATFNTVHDPLSAADHEGDWVWLSLVFRVVDRTILEPPVYTYYSCHSSSDAPWNPRYVLWNDVIRRDPATGTVDSHACVLVAKDSHEGYYATPLFPWPPDVVGSTTYGDHAYFRANDCNVYPFFIGDFGPFNTDWYDVVGMADVLIQSTLINLGNRSHPNPNTAWVTYGGKWGLGDGPFGPFGRGALGVREHPIFASPGGAGDEDLVSWWNRLEREEIEKCAIAYFTCCPPTIATMFLNHAGFLYTGDVRGDPVVAGWAPMNGTGDLLNPAATLATGLGRVGEGQTLYLVPGVIPIGTEGGIRISRAMRIERFWGLSGAATVK